MLLKYFLAEKLVKVPLRFVLHLDTFQGCFLECVLVVVSSDHTTFLCGKEGNQRKYYFH